MSARALKSSFWPVDTGRRILFPFRQLTSGGALELLDCLWFAPMAFILRLTWAGGIYENDPHGYGSPSSMKSLIWTAWLTVSQRLGIADRLRETMARNAARPH
jgi:hypothetical protein